MYQPSHGTKENNSARADTDTVKRKETNQTQYLLQMFLKLHCFGFWKRWKNLCISGHNNLQGEMDNEEKKKILPLKTTTDKRTMFGETNLAAVEVNKPHVVWYFELGFVEEETGWDTNNVGSGSQKQLKKHSSQAKVYCYDWVLFPCWSHLFSRGHAGWQ